MSREIKFRHFDKRNKEMRYSDNDDGEFYVNLKGVIYTYAVPKSESGLKTIYYKSYKVEQFTGLKDKNGVDIYEGDYICLDGLKTHRWEICYSGSGFIASPLSGNSLVEYRTLQNNNYLQFEVIGNIHENKD